MRGRGSLGRAAACAVAAVAAGLTLTGGVPAAPSAPDCDGPVPGAAPGSPAWHAREADNVFCGSQRSRDTQSNPAYSAAASRVQAEHGGPVPEDPFRDPDRLAG